jgi:hypothetical protein
MLEASTLTLELRPQPSGQVLNVTCLVGWLTKGVINLLECTVQKLRVLSL